MGSLCSCFDVRDERAGSVESNSRSAVSDDHISNFLIDWPLARIAALRIGNYDEDSKKNLSESSLKQPSEQASSGCTYICPSTEKYYRRDYKEYFMVNPMRILHCPHYFPHCIIYDWPNKCSPYFHDCRIYHWPEISDICPFCRKLNAQLQRGRVVPVPSSTPIRATVVPSSSVDLTTVPFDDPRFLHLQPQSETTTSIIGKVSSQFHEVSQLSIGNDDNDGVTNELKKPDYDEDSKKNLLESLVKQPSEQAGSGCSYICPPVEDEDDCAICLKKYTLENPKKKLQCSHHFHLSCIYEWLERSETCPFCRKAMLFNESVGH